MNENIRGKKVEHLDWNHFADAEVDNDSCDKIAHFVMNCISSTSNDVKQLTLCVVRYYMGM